MGGTDSSAVRNRLMYDRTLLAYVGRDTARRIGTGDLVVRAPRVGKMSCRAEIFQS